MKPEGVPVGIPQGWHVDKVDVGTYRVEFPRAMSLEVQSWSAMATVTLRPVTETTWQVDFVEDHALVDSAFTFSAVADR